MADIRSKMQDARCMVQVMIIAVLITTTVTPTVTTSAHRGLYADVCERSGLLTVDVAPSLQLEHLYGTEKTEREEKT